MEDTQYDLNLPDTAMHTAMYVELYSYFQYIKSA